MVGKTIFIPQPLKIIMKKPPSMRRRKRYILFQLHTQHPVNFYDVKNVILNSIIKWIGESETARADIKIFQNFWSKKNQRGIIKCYSKHVENIKLSLALVHQIGDEKAFFQILRVSGTLKKLKKIK